MSDEPPFIRPLEVWLEDSPVLTTYGHMVTGSTVTIDVGGPPGDAFVVEVEVMPDQCVAGKLCWDVRAGACATGSGEGHQPPEAPELVQHEE
jgi:hypothetical protein